MPVRPKSECEQGKSRGGGHLDMVELVIVVKYLRGTLRFSPTEEVEPIMGRLLELLASGTAASASIGIWCRHGFCKPAVLKPESERCALLRHHCGIPQTKKTLFVLWIPLPFDKGRPYKCWVITISFQVE